MSDSPFPHGQNDHYSQGGSEPQRNRFHETYTPNSAVSSFNLPSTWDSDLQTPVSMVDETSTRRTSGVKDNPASSWTHIPVEFRSSHGLADYSNPAMGHDVVHDTHLHPALSGHAAPGDMSLSPWIMNSPQAPPSPHWGAFGVSASYESATAPTSPAPFSGPSASVHIPEYGQAPLLSQPTPENIREKYTRRSYSGDSTDFHQHDMYQLHAGHLGHHITTASRRPRAVPNMELLQLQHQRQQLHHHQQQQQQQQQQQHVPQQQHQQQQHRTFQPSQSSILMPVQAQHIKQEPASTVTLFRTLSRTSRPPITRTQSAVNTIRKRRKTSSPPSRFVNTSSTLPKFPPGVLDPLIPSVEALPPQDQRLKQLRESKSSNPVWKAIVQEFNENQEKPLSESTLQMRHRRIMDKLRVWTMPEIQALYLVRTANPTKGWEEISCIMHKEHKVSPKISHWVCKRKWNTIRQIDRPAEEVDSTDDDDEDFNGSDYGAEGSTDAIPGLKFENLGPGGPIEDDDRGASGGRSYPGQGSSAFQEMHWDARR